MKPLHERVRELRKDRKLSLPELFRRTEGVGIDTVRGVETPPGKNRHRYPSPRILQALADALEVPVETFPEFRLAAARRLFDEREIGLDAALANLEILEAVTTAVEEKLPDDDRVATLLSELAATRRPEPAEDDREDRPGIAAVPPSGSGKDLPGR